MKRALRFFAVASAASLALTACSDKSDLVDSERAPAPGEELGAVTLELVQVPADIRCVSVKVESYKTVTRNIDVTPGSTSVYRMTALPTGLARVTGAAFETACASLTEGVVPGWVSEVPVLAQISVVEVTHVALALVRNGRATVGVDFEPVGPGVTPPPPGPVPGGGFSSAAPYIVPVAPGVSTRAILTVGDSVNAKPDGTPYRMVGLPDGMGAFDNSDGTFTLLSNHEIGATAGGAARPRRPGRVRLEVDHPQVRPGGAERRGPHQVHRAVGCRHLGLPGPLHRRELRPLLLGRPARARGVLRRRQRPGLQRPAVPERRGVGRRGPRLRPRPGRHQLGSAPHGQVQLGELAGPPQRRA